jgi:hypothetical protein
MKTDKYIFLPYMKTYHASTTYIHETHTDNIHLIHIKMQKTHMQEKMLSFYSYECMFTNVYRDWTIIESNFFLLLLSPTNLQLPSYPVT